MPRLTAKRRGELVESVAEHTYSQREALREKKNWPQLQRYLGLIGLAGAAEFTWLKPEESAHIRKMAAIEAVSIRERKHRPRTAAAFWKDIREKIGDELMEVESLKESDEMPRTYQNAEKDLAEVKGLVANPMLFALKQSARRIREK